MDSIKNKKELKQYLESLSDKEGLNYLKNWLLDRKKEKNLVYAPGQFECRSLCFPSIKYIHKKYGFDSYSQICKDIGLTLKYNYDTALSFEYEPIEVLCDSREQRPYVKLNVPIKVSTLNFADYAPNPNPENLFIERKELSDWSGVMSKGYSRFERELQRAKDENAYIIVLIESSYNDIESINYLPHTKWIRATPIYLFKRMRDLYLNFDNFQMVAGGTRNECIQLFNQLIKIKNIKQYDLQYLIDTKGI